MTWAVDGGIISGEVEHMGKTISTHNGSAAHRGHNVRDRWAVEGQGHIDPALSGNNLILHDEKPREAYQRIFGEALQRYNEKQDRPERRIRDYYSHIEKDAKKNAVYEMIVQVGDRNDTGLDAPAERECLIQFYEGWKARNPNLECIGAYLHADEKDGTIHMHIDYVPVAHGYKRGMETQTGLVKALGEMGFQKQGKDTAQIQWERRENEVLEAICREHGIEVEHPDRKEKHLDTKLYKVKKELEQAQEQLNELRDDIGIAETEADNWQSVTAVYEQEADKAQKSALEARESLETVKAELNTMQVQKNALEGDIAVLEGKKEELGRELPTLTERIGAARSELATVESAVKRKMDEGAAQFGGMESMKGRIAAARKEAEKNNRLRLLEKFVALPQVKPVWEQFCQMIKSRGRDARENHDMPDLH